METVGKSVTEADAESDIVGGCCECRWATDGADADRAPSVDQLDADIEGARVGIANAVARIVRATNRVEELEELFRKNPAATRGDAELEDELRRSKAEMQASRREKEQWETELQLAESRRQQAIIARDQREDRDERRVFKTVMFWSHFTTYILYFICLMNIFITAFGIYGGSNRPGGSGVGGAEFLASTVARP